MLKVVFFASVREQLGCSSLELDCAGADLDLAGLQEKLCSERGEKWRVVLEQDNLICAVNHVVVTGNCSLRQGDEVAFFPPVTGG